MLGILRPRGEDEDEHQSPEPSTYFGVIDPGNTHLRILIAEVCDRQSLVWGWAEQQGWGGAALEPHGLLAICEVALSQAEEMARIEADRWFLPDQLLVGLPASQLVGRAWSVAQRRSRPHQPVDERELTALLGRALRLAVNRLWSLAVPEGGNPEEPGWLLVDAVPVSLTVDGHGVTDPVGFRGREIGATVFAALGRTEVIEAWQQVAASLEFSTLTLAATPLALAAAESGAQGLLMDVGGRTTDLTWWRNGLPLAIDSLPVGGGAVTDSLILKWGLSPERAERLKLAYAKGRLLEGPRDQVLDVISPALESWLEGTESVLSRLNQDLDEPLPQQIHLLGGGSVLPEVADSVGSLAWSRHLRFERYPQVSRLRPTDIPGVVNRTEQGRGAGDVAVLALAAWAANQRRPPSRPARLLDDLCQA